MARQSSHRAQEVFLADSRGRDGRLFVLAWVGRNVDHVEFGICQQLREIVAELDGSTVFLHKVLQRSASRLAKNRSPQLAPTAFLNRIDVRSSRPTVADEADVESTHLSLFKTRCPSAAHRPRSTNEFDTLGDNRTFEGDFKLAPPISDAPRQRF